MRSSICRNLIKNPIISKIPFVYILSKRIKFEEFDLTMGPNEHPESDSFDLILILYPYLYSKYERYLYSKYERYLGALYPYLTSLT